jgi:uncharacterized membrane protein
VRTTIRSPLASGSTLVIGLALLFFAGCTWASYVRWANFGYRSFDLAYYVQAIWQLIHGRFEGSLEGVPLLGNHVEPIIFVLAPLFLVLRHPMIFVVFQNAALGAMAPVAFRIGLRLGLDRRPALLLAASLLLTPATGYVALHEFHPEALTAPCVLLMIDAQLRGSLRTHWLWFIAVLACKENMALLLGAYCAVHLVLERKRPFAELRRWYLWPVALAILWFVLCAKVITPILNGGQIDYIALYDRLGTSAGDILLKSMTDPQRILGVLWQGISNGNLIWALLVPFLGLSLLRPRWPIIGLPILLQHLLSWRSSEWQIYFHYAAPLIPLFWIALAQAVADITRANRYPDWIRSGIPFLVVGACLATQIVLGPIGDIIASVSEWRSLKPDRDRKLALLSQISPSASVVAPLPYLSHLAMRENLYSLHYILKGLKTLSRAGYEPPPSADFVLVDYEDTATFDAVSGYYHPAMKTVDGRVIPSSEQLLHAFLQRSSWNARSLNELTLFRQESSSRPSAPSISGASIHLGTGATLNGISKSSDQVSEGGVLTIATAWSFAIPRQTFPWLVLKLIPRAGGNALFLTRGLCAPESSDAVASDTWQVTALSIPHGQYDLEILFFDNSRLAWATKSGRADPAAFLLAPPVALGQLEVIATGSLSR